jgi:hypothetical protein
MIPLFIALTMINLLCLLATAVLGYGASIAAEWGAYHQLAGAMATICCCAIHCIVFTYFIATAKWIQHAVSVKKLSEDYLTPTRSFRAQAFPAALLAMLSVFIAAVVGVATYTYHLRPTSHLYAAITAICVNAIVALIEFRAIHRNGKLMDEILRRINGRAQAFAVESPSAADIAPTRSSVAN